MLTAKKISGLSWKALLEPGRILAQLVFLALLLANVIDRSPLLLAGAGAAMLVLGPLFCGWLCPLGFIQDLSSRLGRVLKRTLRQLSLPALPAWAGKVRYAVLAAIAACAALRLAGAPVPPENSAFMTSVRPVLLIGIVLLSVCWPRFYCRVLCPAGALMSVFNLTKRVRIKRNPQICKNCGLCAARCPMDIPLNRLPDNGTLACINCGRCLSACPVPGALVLTAGKAEKETVS
jgi:ferredoxin-type protein NapH